MTEYRIKTKLACEFARIDRQQFNEAVASGLYRCAPLTVRGSTRIFSVDDTIALFIFGRLMRMGFGLREASHIACELLWVFNKDEAKAKYDTAPIAVWVEGLSGMRHAMMTGRALPASVSGIGSIIGGVSFDIPEIRKLINKLAAEEEGILGEDDE